jgi:hypothetical protein
MAGAVLHHGYRPKARRLTHLIKIHRKVLIQIGLGALQQGQHEGRHFSEGVAVGVHIHNCQVTAGTQQATGFVDDGDRRSLGSSWNIRQAETRSKLLAGSPVSSAAAWCQVMGEEGEWVAG